MPLALAIPIYGGAGFYALLYALYLLNKAVPAILPDITPPPDYQTRPHKRQALRRNAQLRARAQIPALLAGATLAGLTILLTHQAPPLLIAALSAFFAASTITLDLGARALLAELHHQPASVRRELPTDLVAWAVLGVLLPLTIHLWLAHHPAVGAFTTALAVLTLVIQIDYDAQLGNLMDAPLWPDEKPPSQTYE